MKVLGIDYGTKRIGVAIGDMETKVAVPFSVIEGLGIRDLSADKAGQVLGVAKIVKEEQIGLIVVGLPLRAEGGKSATQKKVEKFIKELHDVVKIHIVTQDERFTTAEVERTMKGYGKAAKGIDKDAAAAALILQNWFDKV